MQDHMKREPVFLIIDNVTNDAHSRNEVLAYLKVEYHSQSKILVTSRSKEVVKDLLPNFNACMPVPHLNEEEASTIFMNKADPRKSISLLADEEKTSLQRCIQHCRFRSDEGASDENWGAITLWH
jgi:hypothetical protein